MKGPPGERTYLIALGSNVRHPRHGSPRRVLAAALQAMEDKSIRVVAAAPAVISRPIGPSQRDYANSVAVVESERTPVRLLEALKAIERRFGRQSQGARWRARVLDLDIVLWGGGMFADKTLTIPHPHFRDRRFVLAPAAAIAGDWRDPVTGLTVRQLFARLTRANRVLR